MDFKGKFAALQTQFESAMQQLVPSAGTRPERLHAAMRYSLEAGGKRLRPVLTLAVADLYGRKAGALPAAVAIECIHTYSLIHDDLPAMDDDDMRRGRPTCHRQFDEATAILAGDALLTHSFLLLARSYREDTALAAALISEIAHAGGSTKLIGGQMEDLLAEGSDATSEQIEFIHEGKTAALIVASIAAGGLVGGASDQELDTLRSFGRHLGLAFQMVDDILDATATSEALGKTAGKDAEAKKATVVGIHGLDQARKLAAESSAAARAACSELPGDTSFLLALVDSMANRTS
jgi:geranylgeranyl pyrophosphate synthase